MCGQVTHILRQSILLLMAAFAICISATACSAFPLDPLSGTATATVRASSPAVTTTREPSPTRTAGKATATRTRRTTAVVTPSAQPAREATSTPDDGLPTIALARLPREARETIRLIEQGGPFRYKQDGATFQNREGLLPKRPSGYYREYTVVTPGSADRGARRIVGGKGGELYYTDDHYDSFKRVIQ